MAQEKFYIGPGLRQKLGDVIRIVDGSSPASGGISVTPTAPGMARPFLTTFRVCTFTGAWAISGQKTVTFKYVTATPNTVVATNLFCGLDPGTVTTDVGVAREGTAWYLVFPNLTQQPGYATSGTQVMTIQNGVLKWVGTTVCS